MVVFRSVTAVIGIQGLVTAVMEGRDRPCSNFSSPFLFYHGRGECYWIGHGRDEFQNYDHGRD